MNLTHPIDVKSLSPQEKRELFDHLLKMRAYIRENYPFGDNPLSNKERQVLRAMAAGKPRRRIAVELSINVETVKTHIANIYKKLSVNCKDDAISLATKKRYI